MAPSGMTDPKVGGRIPRWRRRRNRSPVALGRAGGTVGIVAVGFPGSIGHNRWRVEEIRGFLRADVGYGVRLTWQAPSIPRPDDRPDPDT